MSDPTAQTTPPPPPGPTARSATALAEEARRLAAAAKGQTTELERRYEAETTELHKRLHVASSATKKRSDRIERLMRDLGERVATDHDAIFELTQRLTGLQQRVDDDMPLKLAAALAGFTTAELKEILAIQEDEDLSDEVLIHAMVNSLGSLRSQLGVVTDVLANTCGQVNEHEKTINQHTQDIEGLTQRVDQFPRPHRHEPFPRWGFVAAAIVGIVAALLWSGHTWHQKVAITAGNVTQNADLKYRFMNSGWMAIFVGLGVAGVVILLVSLTRRYHSRVATLVATRRTTAPIAPAAPTAPPAPPVTAVTQQTEPAQANA